MKISRFLILAALALVCGLSGRVAKADTLDPKVGLGGGGSCGDAVTLTNTTEELTITNFGCVVDFFNTAAIATSVTVTLNRAITPFAGTVSCAPDSFQGDNPPPFAHAATNGDTCTWSGSGVPDDAGDSEFPPTAPGFIGPGGLFGLQFGYPGLEFLDANGHQIQSLDITISTAPVPEPGTLLLLGSGLAALVARKKKLLPCKLSF
jgi:hypothetical protein